VLRSLPWSVETSRRGPPLSLWLCAAPVGLVAEWSLFGWADGRDWVPDLLTGWVLIGCGLVGWSRRPESRTPAPFKPATRRIFPRATKPLAPSIQATCR
jgi:hypothetical protein